MILKIVLKIRYPVPELQNDVLHSKQNDMVDFPQRIHRRSMQRSGFKIVLVVLVVSVYYFDLHRPSLRDIYHTTVSDLIPFNLFLKIHTVISYRIKNSYKSRFQKYPHAC